MQSICQDNSVCKIPVKSPSLSLANYLLEDSLLQNCSKFATAFANLNTCILIAIYKKIALSSKCTSFLIIR